MSQHNTFVVAKDVNVWHYLKLHISHHQISLPLENKYPALQSLINKFKFDAMLYKINGWQA